MTEEDALMASRGWSRETTIRRDLRGIWYHEGERVENPKITRAFDRWVDRAEDGRYCLRNARNWSYVEIEGAPAFVRSVVVDGAGLTMFLSTGETEVLDPSTLRAGSDGGLYASIRQGRLAARFDSAALGSLSGLLQEEPEGLVFRLGARSYPLRTYEDPVTCLERL
jgi:uncharacterized protein